MDYKTFADNLIKPGFLYESNSLNEETITKAVCEYALVTLKNKFDRIEWRYASSKKLLGSSFFIFLNDIIPLLVYYGNDDKHDDVFHNIINIVGIDTEMKITPDFLNKINLQFLNFYKQYEWCYTDNKFDEKNDNITNAMRMAFCHSTDAIIPANSEEYNVKKFTEIVNEINENVAYKHVDDDPLSRGISTLCCDDDIAQIIISNFESEIETKNDIIHRLLASIKYLIDAPNTPETKYQNICSAFDNLKTVHNNLVDKYNDMIDTNETLISENQKLRSINELSKKLTSSYGTQKYTNFGSPNAASAATRPGFHPGPM